MAKRICSVDGCERTVVARGWCSPHYDSFRRHGDPLKARRVTPRPASCEVRECDSPVLARGICNKHYHAFTRYGDPLGSTTYKKDLPCGASECLRPQRRYGYCSLHSQRYIKYGTPDLPEKETRLCEGPSCDRAAGMSGLCRSHYAQQRRGKTLAPLEVQPQKLGRPKFCIFDGCDNPHKARGYCKQHNQHIVIDGFPKPLQQHISPPGPCSVEDCERHWLADGLCKVHYSNRRGRWSKYGITFEQGMAIYEKQERACGICHEDLPIHKLSIDHDHQCCHGRKKHCGKCVRGLLCMNCNMGIGQLKDDPVRILSAYRYINRLLPN